MGSGIDSFEQFANLKTICKNLIHNPKNVDYIKELNSIIKNSSHTFVKVVQPTVLSTFYPILKCISEKKSSFRDDEKQIIVDTLKNIFDKSFIDKEGLFFNIYAFLLFEIYDHVQHKVLPIHEEYKLSIMECMTSLAKCLSSELIFNVYRKENAPKLCQMLYVSVELAKTEQLRKLRIAAVKCILSIARVLEDKDFQDVVIRNQVADIFIFFLPGVASGLKKVALEDEKVGHQIHMEALKAWGRIITLLMQDYNAADEKFDLTQIKTILKQNSPSSTRTEKVKRFKNDKEIKEYLQGSQRTVQWYSETDKKLQDLVVEFTKLTHHSHPKVRLELANTCGLVTENCFLTMPRSVSHLIEIVIVLTEDEDNEVLARSREILTDLSKRLSSKSLKVLLENLEEGFYNGVNSLPRKFNGIDEREQLASLNLIIGYINLFGEHKLSSVLLCAAHLSKLMSTLLYVSELEKTDVSLLEEYEVKDLEVVPYSNAPWKKFRHFKEDSVKVKLEKLCALLAKFGAFRIVSDFLLDAIEYDLEHRKEAILILNETMLGIDYNTESIEIVRNIVNTYIDTSYWQIPLSVSVDEYGYESTLGEVQNNIVQVCLLVEGVGKVALALQKHFQEFLLKILYLVIERAGSSHPLVKAAGLSALMNITHACGYARITSLINNNIDYFTYHVERKLNRIENNENVLNVLSVVLKYSNMDVLQYIADIINEVLMQSCDKFKERNATAFLQVFKIFVQCLRGWLDVQVKLDPIKSKAEREKEEMKYFKVSGINVEEKSFSDEIMGKTAEEMFKEDMGRKQKELEKEILEPEVEGYKKPNPPLHIKMTVAVLSRSLHFLPSKDRTRKLLALAILTDGLEIIRDWEDELLPIVHKIWSPLVERFKEFEDPLIINCSFRLLATLARLSKNFIRLRTTKEVLPSILLVLDRTSKDSYLKDKGSAYRYSQRYKLQQTILENLGRIFIDLDMQEEKVNQTMDLVFKYLSNKQPIPLQATAIGFFKTFALFDPKPVKLKVDVWKKENIENEYEKNVDQLYIDLVDA